MWKFWQHRKKKLLHIFQVCYMFLFVLCLFPCLSLHLCVQSYLVFRWWQRQFGESQKVCSLQSLQLSALPPSMWAGLNRLIPEESSSSTSWTRLVWELYLHTTMGPEIILWLVRESGYWMPLVSFTLTVGHPSLVLLPPRMLWPSHWPFPSLCYFHLFFFAHLFLHSPNILPLTSFLPCLRINQIMSEFLWNT